MSHGHARRALAFRLSPKWAGVMQDEHWHFEGQFVNAPLSSREDFDHDARSDFKPNSAGDATLVLKIWPLQLN